MSKLLASVSVLSLLVLGAACSTGDDDLRARLSLKLARATLYDAPFPSDDLRRPDGTIDLSLVPNPEHVPIVDKGIALLARDTRGFALAGGVFFRADRPPRRFPPTATPTRRANDRG